MRVGHAGRKRRGYGCRPNGGALGEQRRYADVASDMARSRVFTTVLIDTGRLSSFLKEAVVVLTGAAADVSGSVSAPAGAGWGGEGGSSAWPRGGRDDGGRDAGGGCDGGGGDSNHYGRLRVPPSSERIMRPEPLLRALCSFCLEHSPARSAFIQALLDGSGGSSSMKPSTRAGGGGTGGKRTTTEGSSSVSPSSSCSASAASSSSSPSSSSVRDPLAALFVLCLHPHLPSAAAASMLLQCLLVGGGALGAVSGPSPSAVAGVGVIPSAYHPAGAWAAGGIGREDPLQAALLERIGGVALSEGVTGRGVKSGGGDSRCAREKYRPMSASDGKAVRVEGIGGVSFSRAGGDGGSDVSGGDGVGGGAGGDGVTGSAGECSGGSDSDSEGEGAAWPTCGNFGAPAGFSSTNSLSRGSSTTGAFVGGALIHFVWRLQEIGADLAAAQAKQQLRLGAAGGGVGGGGDVESRKQSVSKEGATAGSSSFARIGGGLKARSVEMEQELTSLLCLLSSLVSLRVLSLLSSVFNGPGGGCVVEEVYDKRSVTMQRAHSVCLHSLL